MPTSLHHAIRSGSKEYILVTVADRIESVSNIGPLNPTFSVYDENDVVKQTDVPADVDVLTPMVARCLVDTTVGGNWPSNRYRLFLKLTASPEAPILGPVTFDVEEL